MAHATTHRLKKLSAVPSPSSLGNSHAPPRSNRMESEEGKFNAELKEKVLQAFKDFMTRIAKLDELGTVGSRLLNGFQQGLAFLRRPPINRESELIENIIKANETRRLKSYLEAGCVNNHDSMQNISKSKIIIDELEHLLEDLSGAIANDCLLPLRREDFSNQLDQLAVIHQEEITSSNLEELEMTHYTTLISVIFSMVKQDYLMQERIVTSLSLKSSSGELESYCMMWSLHPFINNEIMHHAWRFIS